MTDEQSLANALPRERRAHASELSGCEPAVELRQAIDALQRENQELKVLIAELERVAGTDKLTGAWNRRRLAEAADGEMERLKRYGHPLSVLVLDIDLFKRVNDTYGHAAGDRLLVELSGRIRSVLRSTDSLTRWGGEEFVVLCPNTALPMAAVFAERLRGAIAGTEFSVGESTTVSIGAAECLPGETWELWFHRADAMLLRAKASGRNQVRVAPEIPMRAGATEEDPSNLVRLVWRRAYECGHEVVDHEHKALFGDVNDLLATIVSGRPVRETGAIADTLIRDVARHFQDEESIIAAAGYPRAARHAALHRALVARALILVERFRAGEANMGEIFQFLAHDLIARHILRADRDFFSYLQRQSRHEAAQRWPAPALPA